MNDLRNLDAVSGFYRDVIGLTVMAKNNREATLGNSRTPLVVLEADPALTPLRS